jgi:hypothetical protein
VQMGKLFRVVKCIFPLFFFLSIFLTSCLSLHLFYLEKNVEYHENIYFFNYYLVILVYNICFWLNFSRTILIVFSLFY